MGWFWEIIFKEMILVDALKYLKQRQQIWAERKNKKLIGSQGDRGEKLYTETLNENLFKQMSQDTNECFKSGDGNELGNGTLPGKMQALHSSSALTVNIFDYWKDIEDKTPIAKSLLIPSTLIKNIGFEKKYPILENSIHPNIDVVFNYKNGYCCAIECKFTEPFSKRQREYGFKEKYFDGFRKWDIVPEIYKLATLISPEDKAFEKLHAAQLIKHILGLLASCNYQKNKFRLIYLYYGVFGDEGCKHEKEIAEFKEIVKKDGIAFQAITWQTLICNLYRNCTYEHDTYIKYISERYV